MTEMDILIILQQEVLEFKSDSENIYFKVLTFSYYDDKLFKYLIQGIVTLNVKKLLTINKTNVKMLQSN